MTIWVFIASCVLVQVNPANADLQGIITDESGNPVAGARVDITTAAPRVGEGIFCPSCYRDCAKSTRTDGVGRFTLRDLDPSLKFRLLIAFPGKKPTLTKLIDPLAEMVGIALKDQPKDLPPERLVQGIVVDDEGFPVEGALVDPAGAKTAERQWGGSVPVDPAVCDSKGQFSLLLPADYLGLDVEVSADGYGGILAKLLAPGKDVHRIVVPSGTRVLARLVYEGKPVANVRVAVVQTDRSAGRHFIKAVERVSDENGKVTFDCLPAEERYAIFTVVGAGTQSLVLTTKKFKARGNRQERDLGDLNLVKPLALSGRIDLPKGATLPLNARLVLQRDPAWDLITIPVSFDGSFKLEGLPPESYVIRLALKGMTLNAPRIPYQVMDDGSFGLRVTDTVTDLRIPLLVAEGNQP